MDQMISLAGGKTVSVGPTYATADHGALVSIFWPARGGQSYVGGVENSISVEPNCRYGTSAGICWEAMNQQGDIPDPLRGCHGYRGQPSP